MRPAKLWNDTSTVAECEILTDELGGLEAVLGLTGNLRPALNLGVGVRVYTSKAVSWRLDITNNVVFSNKIFNVPVLQLALALNFGASE